MTSPHVTSADKCPAQREAWLLDILFIKHCSSVSQSGERWHGAAKRAAADARALGLSGALTQRGASRPPAGTQCEDFVVYCLFKLDTLKPFFLYNISFFYFFPPDYCTIEMCRLFFLRCNLSNLDWCRNYYFAFPPNSFPKSQVKRELTKDRKLNQGCWKVRIWKPLSRSVVWVLLSCDFNNSIDSLVVKRFPGEAGTSF